MAKCPATGSLRRERVWVVVFDNGQQLSHVAGLIDLFHSGGVILTVVVLELGHLLRILVGGVVLTIEAKTELDHSVDSGGVGTGVLERETGGEKGGFVKKQDKILDGFVVLVSLDLLSELLDDNVVGVDFQVLLGSHVTHGGGVLEGLGLHDSLHVGGPAIL